MTNRSASRQSYFTSSLLPSSSVISFQPSFANRNEEKTYLIFSISIFDYDDLVFFDMKWTLEAKLEVAQNNCIRCIYILRCGDSITSYRMRLGFLKPQSRRRLRMFVFLYVFLFGSSVPAYLRNILVSLVVVMIPVIAFAI
jgi:hypothetical protein